MFWVGLAKQPGHSTPVSGGTGVLPLPPLRFFEAEHVGEERIGGKRTNGTFNNDMASEMEMRAEEHVSQIPFYLEPMRCAHIGKVQCCMNCAP